MFTAFQLSRVMQSASALVAAIAPIDGVALVTEGPPCVWRIDFQAGVSAAKQKEAKAALAAFDIYAPTAMDVSDEYTRRLIKILGARDLAHAAFIRADNDIEMRHLAALKDKKPAETALLAKLQDMHAAVLLLIEAYNDIPDRVPRDFAADKHWKK